MGMFDVLDKPLDYIRQGLVPEPQVVTNVPDKTISTELMSKLPFDVLLKMRDVYSDDPVFQKKIAPYEHKAFAKMLVEHNPAFWTPALAVMTPSYQAYKAIKQDYKTEKDATPPDIKQVMEGYKGIWEGLQSNKEKSVYTPLQYKDPFGDTTK
jgi:hypothetical protein